MSASHYYEGGVRSGRKESPAIEHSFQDEVIQALTELLEKKGMYQNVHISEAIFEKLPPEFSKEFRTRPISPISRGEGDDHNRPSGRVGLSPIGESEDEREVGFYLPNLTIDCLRCKRTTTYLSMICSSRAYHLEPYPLKNADTEQVFNLYYRCAICRKSYIVFQVYRKGFKLQLTGRSTPFRPAIANEWPKGIKPVVEASYLAAAEGDLPAAYYHLRTAVEFFLKQQLKIPVSTKIEGNELCDKYNEQVDARLKTGIPTFGPIYTELSTGLHTREVDAARFEKLCQDFLAHLKAKELFSQYSQ